MAQTALKSELQQLCAEIRSQKVSNRVKALDRLDTILSSRKEEIIQTINENSSSMDLSWSDIFNSCVQAAVQHCVKISETSRDKQQTLKNRNPLYAAVLTKIVEYSTESETCITPTTILETVISVLENKIVFSHFGCVFLKILEAGVLNHKLALENVKMEQFKNILTSMFNTVGEFDENLTATTVRVINKVIDTGILHTQLSVELAVYFPLVKRISALDLTPRTRAEFITLSYLLATHAAIDNHECLTDCLEDILPILCNNFEFRLKQDIKKQFFTTCSIFLCLKFPFDWSVDNPEDFKAVTEGSQTKIFSLMSSIVESELKEMSFLIRRDADETYLKEFYEFAAQISIVTMFLPTNPSRDDEPRRKVIKRIENFERLTDCIDKGQGNINWRWFLITAHVLAIKPTLLKETDYQPFLQILVNTQGTSEFSRVLEAVRYCCELLLFKQNELLESALINNCYCKKLWQKIVESTTQDSFKSNNSGAENSKLLATLIRHKQLPTDNFVYQITETCISDSRTRSNAKLELINAILTSYGNELKRNAKLIHNILIWLLPNTNRKIAVQEILTGNEKIDLNLIAENILLCVTNQNIKIPGKYSTFSTPEYIELSEKLQIKLLKKMLFTKMKECTGKTQEDVTNQNASIHRPYFDFFKQLLLGQSETEATQDDINDFIQYLEKLHTLYVLMNKFRSTHVSDVENINQFPPTKKIIFLHNQIEIQCELLDARASELTYVNQICHKIQTIFNAVDDKELKNFMVKQNYERFSNFLRTSLRFFSGKHPEESEDRLFIKKTVLEILKSLSLLGETRFIDYDIEIDRDTAQNFFQLVKIQTQQKPTENVAEWITSHIKDICSKFHGSETISRLIVDSLPDLSRFVDPFNKFHMDICVILSSFLKKIYRSVYSTKLACQILFTVKNIARKSINLVHNPEFQLICKQVCKFLESPSLEIRFAAIKCIGFFLSEEWIYSSFENLENIQRLVYEIFSQIQLKTLAEKHQEDFDSSDLATIFQCFFTVLSVNSCLREESFLKLSFFCKKFNIPNVKPILCLEQTYKYLKTDCVNFSKKYACSLIRNSLRTDLSLQTIPWYLICDTEECFLKNYSTEIAFMVLRFCPTNLKTLSENTGISLDELVQQSCSYAFPFLISLELTTSSPLGDANLLKRTIKELGVGGVSKRSAKAVLFKYFFNLTSYLWDSETFESFHGIIIPPKQTEITLKFSELKAGIDKWPYNKGEIKSFKNVLEHQSVVVIDLLTALKLDSSRALYTSDFLLCLFRYCAIVQLILDCLSTNFPKRPSKNICLFFIRDIITSFCKICHAQKSDSVALLATLNFFKQVSKTLIESFSDLAEKFVVDIIRSLVPLISGKDGRISAVSLEILESFLCSHGDIFSESIANMDALPKDKVFDSVRHKHEEFNNRIYNSSLFDTITYFLKVPFRGIEALSALRQTIVRKKNELFTLYLLLQGDAKNQKHEENCLFKLVRSLLTTSRSRDPLVSIEAAKCLGELGPAKLHTTALLPHVNNSSYARLHDRGSAAEFLCSQILEQLDICTYKCDYESLPAVNKVCRILVNSRQSSNLVNTPFLAPFSEHEKHSFPLSFSTTTLNFTEIFKRVNENSYSKWIKKFTSEIFAALNCFEMRDLALMEEFFCESTLIPALKFILAQGSNEYLSALTDLVNYFFSETFKLIKGNKDQADLTIFKEKRIIKCFINIAECIRARNVQFCEKNELNSLHIAGGSMFCQAYFTSILFLELWALSEASSVIPKKKLRDNADFQMIAKEAYRATGHDDAILGFLNVMDSRMDYLNIQNQWSTVLLEMDVDTSSSTDQYTEQLRRSGFYSLAAQMKPTNADYETLWRLGTWDADINPASSVLPASKICSDLQSDLEQKFQYYHYQALKAIKSRDETGILGALEDARRCIVQILAMISTECTQSVYKYLSWLQLVQQIDDFYCIQFSKFSDVSLALNKWSSQDAIEYGSFEHKEIILSQRKVLLKECGIRAKRKIDEFFKNKNVLAHTLHQIVKECKVAGNTNLLIRNIKELKSLDSIEDIKIEVFMEEAEMFWKLGNVTIAKSILHHVTHVNEFGLSLKKIDAVRKYGEYVADNNEESFEQTNLHFFQGAIKLLENFSAKKDELAKRDLLNLDTFPQFYNESRRKNYAIVAKYADREYNQLSSLVKSEDFKMKKELMTVNVTQAQNAMKTGNIVEKQKGNLMLRNSGIDEHEIKLTESNRSQYLYMAVKNYLECCRMDDNFDGPFIFRIIALWFANKDDEILAAHIKELIEKVPSYKFIGVLNQITARLNTQCTVFIEIIKALLVRCAIEHPHHALLHLFAHANARADDGRNSVQDSREKVVLQIINSIETRQELRECVNQTSQMFSALIDFANTEIKDKKKIKISNALKQLKTLSSVHCPTMKLAVSKNRDYNLTYILSWNEEFGHVGGINYPKKLSCLCSDGVERPQLLKGKDDLRQDAVMQQALGIANDVLKENKETLERKLQIRTYKVVPLSKRSGILEWCENTIPLGVYLCGSNKTGGAHKKYRPNDWSSSVCRNKLQEKAKNSPADKLQVFNEICEKIKPVFHHFFFEKFLSPAEWFEKRLSYINSIATTSMVGYILGLGDRHVHNILIDEITAEVIHIDFGIAFDQGKVMPTPELVPFRLTRDILAPMGISEVEGVFRKSCEKTLQALRSNNEAILTTLEVLLYDPLYSWILDSRKVFKSQATGIGENSDNEPERKNATAHRALLRVKAKLDGVDGIVAMTSVEAQVEKLIKEACSSRNLCRLFCGWDPYL